MYLSCRLSDSGVSHGPIRQACPVHRMRYGPERVLHRCCHPALHQRLKPAQGAAAFIFLFQLFYGVGFLPVPWLYPSEINTTRTRSRMQAIASGWNWMAVFAVVKITPIAIQNIQWRIFIVFDVLNAAFIPVIYCFYPETKGLELEDIPLLFPKRGITGGVFSS